MNQCCLSTGAPSSSCEMIIIRNNSHGEIIRVFMGILTTALRNKKYSQIFNENTSPYFYSVSLAIWPLTMLRRTHFSELSNSRFTTYIRKAQGCTLHFVKRQNWHPARIFIIGIFLTYLKVKNEWKEYIIISQSVKTIISQLIISCSLWPSYFNTFDTSFSLEVTKSVNM